ncbi:MAG: N-substituted formamide deformylase [Steroidobacteraceae bacterium]|nr:N-substituted formamide deformylase [Steroidobacteraceae bacterium]
MLIRNAELGRCGTSDMRIDGGFVTQLGERLPARSGETVLDARGGALVRGLHDHHLHVLALATSLASLRCGPPGIVTEDALACRLREHAASLPANDDAWIRGIAYHESVAGDIDRAWLDRIVADRPVRIQHRSGRLWIVNSRGLERLAAGADANELAPLRANDALATGRLYDLDPWLRRRLGGSPPALHAASALLASFGVTGITDASARNSRQEFRHFVDATARAELLQRVCVMGDAGLDAIGDSEAVKRGPTKIYLRESSLPTLEDLCAAIAGSHDAGRAIAVHCVTEAEIVFALAALAAVGSRPGDRIEHASVAPPAVLALIAEQRVTVVTQPNFVRERGDAYLADVAARDCPWLYRGRAFLDAGIALAAGTDAPLGEPDPWLAMQAAVDRRTQAGQTLGCAEALTPEEALGLFSGDPLAPGTAAMHIAPGTPADLCLLDRPWSAARCDLAAVRVIATLRGGQLIWQRG